MSQIKQIVSAVDKVDVTVVGVSPSPGPGLGNLKVVAAVRKSRTALYDLDVTDREVMFMPEMSAKMLIRNTTGMLFVTFLLVLLLPLDIFVIVAMIVLGKEWDHSCEQHRRTNGARRGESFHVKTSRELFLQCWRIPRPGHKIKVTYSRC
jgi:hypothetical protein